jgi:hypothetical protein
VAVLRKELTSRAHVSHDVKSYVTLISRLFGYSNLICRLKPHQIHDLAAAKEKEMERVRRAFGIRDDYVEGDAFKQMKEREAE